MTLFTIYVVISFNKIVFAIGFYKGTNFVLSKRKWMDFFNIIDKNSAFCKFSFFFFLMCWTKLES